MDLQTIITNAVQPALQIIGVRDTPEGRLMLLAIGLQESRFEHRRQLGNGPARGFWQFEAGGGVKGVMTHLASRDDARRIAQTPACRGSSAPCGPRSSATTCWPPPSRGCCC